MKKNEIENDWSNILLQLFYSTALVKRKTIPVDALISLS